MDAEEISKLVDGVYKNILEKFTPSARNLITTGKTYLKAMHGAAAASSLFNEALCKVAANAQQSGTSDIGEALKNIVEVYRDLQEQQINILKAFYVDLLVPLETNLEKDTKVIQHEQKKIAHQMKAHMEGYQKAVTTMKKQRKKKATIESTEKALEGLQSLEDHKLKLDTFCDDSYKNALTQERRRYGFILERQCSIAKHWMTHYGTGRNEIAKQLDYWHDVAVSREAISDIMIEKSLGLYRPIMERLPNKTNSNSKFSQLKKARSIDAPFGDVRNFHESNDKLNSLPRAKSDFNLTAKESAMKNMKNDHVNSRWDQRPTVSALYAYMPSGENQLPFEEGECIALVGTPANGWQFGENLRTHLFGWFPIAYTRNGSDTGSDHRKSVEYRHASRDRNDSDSETEFTSYRTHKEVDKSYSPTRMFGDTITLKKSQNFRGLKNAQGNPSPGPPPAQPAPVPANSQSSSNHMVKSSRSFYSSNGADSTMERRKYTRHNGSAERNSSSIYGSSHMNRETLSGHIGIQRKSGASSETMLHSSGVSSFVPPPQPEIDYSDEEQSNRVPIRSRTLKAAQYASENDSATLTRSVKNINLDNYNSIGHSNTGTAAATHNNKSGSPSHISTSRDNLFGRNEIATGTGIKRTKSFWKFGGGRGEPILSGMSMWQHRDLIASTNMENKEQRNSDEGSGGGGPTMNKAHMQSGLMMSNGSRSSSSRGTYDEDELALLGRNNAPSSMNANNNNTNKNHEESLSASQQQLDQSQNRLYATKSHMKHSKGDSLEKSMDQNAAMHAAVAAAMQDDLAYYKEESYRDMETPTPTPSPNKYRSEMKVEIGNQKKGNANNSRNSRSTHNAQNKNSTEENSAKMMNQKHSQKQQQQANPSNGRPRSENVNDLLRLRELNDFYDDRGGKMDNSGGVIMKGVKRKEILKQYYTSEDDGDDMDSDDVELKSNSTTTDQYDCIVVNDHLVKNSKKLQHHIQKVSYQEQHNRINLQTFRATTTTIDYNDMGSNSPRNRKGSDQLMEPSTLPRNYKNGSVVNNNTPTATILPRTRLMKIKNASSKIQHNNNNVREDVNSEKIYGPWFDFWNNPDQSQQQPINSK